MEHLMGCAVASLIEAVQAKDAYTRSHSLRVSRYARAIARKLGLSPREQAETALAGELHDVGKIGVPDELLHKAGALTPEERYRFLDHTVIGERILAPLLVNRPVLLAAVRSHHERVDGSGYPDGLRGTFIPLVARILAVADAFDAMTSARPYRRALPRAVALVELRRAAGSQFDPRCVRAFLALLAGRPGGVITERTGRRPTHRDKVPGGAGDIVPLASAWMYGLKRRRASRGPPWHRLAFLALSMRDAKRPAVRVEAVLLA